MKSMLAAFCILGGGIAFTAVLVNRPLVPSSLSAAIRAKKLAAQQSAAELRAARIKEQIKRRELDRRYDEEQRENAAFERWKERVLPTPRNRFPKIGTCYSTKVKWVGERLEPDSSGLHSGSAILFENALNQVSYGMVPPVVRSRPGDKVTMCVVSLPKHCPKGDFRGVEYRTYNRRTREHWQMIDSEHVCGGQ